MNHPFQNIYGQKTKIGKNSKIGAYVEVSNAKIGNNCTIGAYTFICQGVEIGNNVFIGPRVTFTNDKNPPSEQRKWLKTIVQDNVVIGAGAIILPGVIIKTGAVIGAGSVVTKNVDKNSTVIGNPAHKIVNKNEN